MSRNKDIIIETELKIFNYAIGDIIRAIKGGALMVKNHIIDYLAQIANYSGRIRANNKDDYTLFIDEFFQDYNSGKLWAIRCALLHTYGLSKAMEGANLLGYSFSHKNSENHKKFENGIYWLNLSDFLFDVIKSSFNFFYDLKCKSENELTPYLDRLKILTVKDDITGEIKYFDNFYQIDDILSPIDEVVVNWDLLKSKIDKLCQSK